MTKSHVKKMLLTFNFIKALRNFNELQTIQKAGKTKLLSNRLKVNCKVKQTLECFLKRGKTFLNLNFTVRSVFLIDSRLTLLIFQSAIPFLPMIFLFPFEYHFSIFQYFPPCSPGRNMMSG